MPKIVGLVAKVDYGSDVHILDVDGRETPTTVHFDGGAVARLSPDDPRTPGYAQLLDELHRESLPVYAEVDHVTSFVTALQVPLVVKVRHWTRRESGDVIVDLQPSSAPHVLRATLPDFQEVFDALRQASERGQLVAVTQAPRRTQILDVTPTNVPLYDWDHNLAAGGALGLHDEPPPELLSDVTTVGSARADELFDAMFQAHCRVDSVAAPCIPFAYPDDGCHARAHRMCELLLKNYGVRAGKIWLFGDPYPNDATLHPRTPNNPECSVLWRYHVAPFLQVETSAGPQVRVLDPSLFAALVPREEWKDVQRDPRARFDFTAASIYDRPENGKVYTDPAFSATPRDLAPYRHLLVKRIEDEGGPPPYCKAPLVLEVPAGDPGIGNPLR